MRALFLILLGLTFAMPVQAVDAPKVPQEIVAPSKEKKQMCNPQEETKMPETFY